MAPLTAKEIAVLRLSCQGLQIKQIAQRLDVSPKTAAAHRFHIGEKTGCTTGTQLGVWAVANGIVDIPKAT